MFPHSFDIERIIVSEQSSHELARALFDRYCVLPEKEKESFALALIGQLALKLRRHQLP